MVDDLVDDRRTDPDLEAPEREMLEQWLAFHRVTLLLKCEGLSDAQRKSRPVGTSNLSLHGLVRHMAEVERGWFQRCLARQREIPRIWARDDIEDSEMVPLTDAVWEADLAQWHEECETSVRLSSQHSLEDVGLLRSGDSCSLRWILHHMIEEYARHNGHADLLRELIDGEVGC